MKREDGRVWLEGVPPTELLGNMFHLDGFPAAMRSVLKYKGVEDKYMDDDIFAAITGQPFRFWFSPDWASCLGYTHEEPLGVVVAKVLGFEYNWHAGSDRTNIDDLVEHKKALNRDAVAMAWQELVREIEAGNPVILFGGDTIVDPKAGPVIVTGYDTQRQLIYFVPTADWRLAPKWDDADKDCKEGIKELGYRGRKRPDETNWIGNGFAPGQGMGGAKVSFFAFRGRARRPTEHEVAIAVIKRAVDFARGKLIDDLRKSRRPGLEAFDLLAQCLDQDVEQFEYEGRKRPWTEIGREDWWYAMECLGGPTFRKAASAFLRRCAEGFGDFSGEQRKVINAAAESYDGSNTNMIAFWNLFELVGPIEEYEDRTQTTGKALSSREIRKQAAKIIRDIRRNEENAISSLGGVLALENARTSYHLS